nr:MAG TPA: YedD-like protein [Microviridae sp.]
MYISEKGKCNQWQKFIALHFRTMSEGEEDKA